MGKPKRWFRKLRFAGWIVNTVRKADVGADHVFTLTWGERGFKNDLAERVAAEIRRSAIEPGKVAWISIDSDGAIHVADGRVADSVNSVRHNLYIALKAFGW